MGEVVMKNYLFALKYFERGDSISGANFHRERQVEFINLQHISSISEIKEFTTPLTGTIIGKAAVVIMKNDDTFFIDPLVQEELLSYFKILNA